MAFLTESLSVLQELRSWSTEKERISVIHQEGQAEYLPTFR